MEPIKLKKIIKNIPGMVVRGSKEIQITGITSHSKTVAPGYLFIARKGLARAGTDFIPEAIANGAVAVVTDMYDPFYPHIVQIIHPDLKLIEASIVHEYYGHPSDKLFLVGITGTNGKTTTAYLLHHLFSSMKKQCGLIGTIEWRIGSHVFPSTHTTPDLLTHIKLFHEMLVQGCNVCVSEVSSHALAQGRVHGIEFDTAVFTHLTQDHLDYHHSMGEYAQVKSQLFASLNQKGRKTLPKTAVINRDCPYYPQMLSRYSGNTLFYGIDAPCDIYASQIVLDVSGLRFDVTIFGKTYPFSCRLIGRYNVYNLLAAIGVGISYGFPVEAILSALTDASIVPGRLERVENNRGIHLFVDYAHTNDALFNVLMALKAIAPKRLITVFGCGGNRDQTKRAKMGAVAEELSDLVILTNDNPRYEDPHTIIRHILTGVKDSGRVLVILDREEAIARAIALAQPDDTILVAGKGHEAYQIFAHQMTAFDDRAVLQRLGRR